MARRPFSTPGNLYPQFSQTSEDGPYSSAPQSPLHNGNSTYETASELSVYQSALDVDDTRSNFVKDVLMKPTNRSPPINGRPSSVAPLIEDTSMFMTPPIVPSRSNTELFFRDGIKRIDFVLAFSRAEGLSQEERNVEARRTFEENLKKEGLCLEHETEDCRNVNFVKIHAPWEVLTRYAEIMKFKMPMKRLEKLTHFGELDALDNPIGLAVAFSQSSMFPNLAVDEEEVETETSESTLTSGFLRRLINVFALDPSVFPRRVKRVKAEFNREKEFLFKIPENREDFFNSSQRSRIIDFIMKRKRFNDNLGNIFAFGITRLLADNVYSAAYPLHEGLSDDRDATDMRSLLRREWASLAKLHKYQPLDSIKEYFGVMIGLYFAWIGFYTFMLIPASIVGLGCFIYGCFTLYTFVPSEEICGSNYSVIMCPVCDQCQYWKVEDTCSHSRITSYIDNPAIVVFAIFMSFWGAVFLELWKRYSSRITYQWDLTGFDQSEEHPRPEYLVQFQHVTKRKRMNRVTGVEEPYISFWRRKFPAVIMSISVVLLLVSIAMVAVIGVIFYRMSISVALSLQYDSYDHKGVIDRNVPLITTSTAACINLVFIMILNRIYGKVAEYLTELEIPRTQTDYDDSLTLKMFSLQFVNYYASIFYIAFFKGKFIGYPGQYKRLFGYRQEECGPGGCLMELTIQLAIIMVGKQTLNAFMEMLLPVFYRYLNVVRHKLNRNNLTKKMVPSWERDFQLVDVGALGLFWEYLEMILQFGFVTIFVTAFPLAPLFALLNNMFETRLDAKKFLNLYRRPVSRRIRNIGVWYRIMDCIGKISIITNAFIIAFTSNFIPSLVYRHTLSPDGSLDGYLNFSLSYFRVDDFAKDYMPKTNVLYQNITFCRYDDFREPPWSNNKYDASAYFWYLMIARLTFVVVFENVVMISITLLRWLVPDVPRSVQEKVRHEAYLTNEIVVEHEYMRARRHARFERMTRRDVSTMVKEFDLIPQREDTISSRSRAELSKTSESFV